MKGVSEIIVIILILMIAISLSAIGYITFTNIFNQMKTSSEQSMSNTVSSLLAQMKIDSITIGTGGADTMVNVSNVGKVDLTAFSAYVNEKYVNITSGTPAGGKISPGEVKNINISHPPVNPAVQTGDVIKITSAQGAMGIKIAT